MILRLVPFVRGSERRGLADGDGAEQEQRERVSDAVACPPHHGEPVYSQEFDAVGLPTVTGAQKTTQAEPRP
jgi:hypothetical protein